MPETQEGDGNFMHLDDFMTSSEVKLLLAIDPSIFTIQDLAADASDHETEQGLAPDGLVMILEPTCTLTRGGNMKKEESCDEDEENEDIDIGSLSEACSPSRPLLPKPQPKPQGRTMLDFFLVKTPPTPNLSASAHQEPSQQTPPSSSSFHLQLLGSQNLTIDPEDRNPNNLRPYSSAYKKHQKEIAEATKQPNREYLYPQCYQVPAKHTSLRPSLRGLMLVHIMHATRAVILQFQRSINVSKHIDNEEELEELWLRLAYLTHTSVQIFKIDIWNNSVKLVPRKERKYHIGLAIIFKTHVIAFLTHDLVFLPMWRPTFAELRDNALDVYQDYSTFLKTVATWMKYQYRIKKKNNGHSPRPQLATKSIRDANHVWLGVGVYTVSELFFMAGLSPFLTEEEVFDSPSRTARLCEAFWAYNHKSRTDLRALLRKATVDGLLAPTVEQRVTYKDWLYVHGKSRVQVTPRQLKLIKNYKDRLSSLESIPNTWYRIRKDGYNTGYLFDTFEPNVIRPALDASCSIKPSLGHLIFGSDRWAKLTSLHATEPSVSAVSVVVQTDDALTPYFRARGDDSHLHLDLDVYESLYSVPLPNNRRSFWNYAPTYTYSTDKQIWSVVPNFPSNSKACSLTTPSKVSITRYSETERNKLMFKYIVTQTRQVAIGPLEYSGNVKVIKRAHGKKALAIAGPFDPTLPLPTVERNVKILFRKREKLSRKGMTSRQKQKQKKEVQQVTETYHDRHRSSNLPSQGQDSDSISDDDTDDMNEDDLKEPSDATIVPSSSSSTSDDDTIVPSQYSGHDIHDIMHASPLSLSSNPNIQIPSSPKPSNKRKRYSFDRKLEKLGKENIDSSDTTTTTTRPSRSCKRPRIC